jgi:outer membrane protein assembly factor BamE (lipoprotein component of BamABCDE complex)
MNTQIFPSAPSHGHRNVGPTLLLALLAMLVVAVAGCVTGGRDFPVDRVSDIRMGETTQSEIREMFGAPFRVGIEDGQKTWTYLKYRIAAFRDERGQDLVIRFDDRNVVSSYTFNTTEHQE